MHEINYHWRPRSATRRHRKRKKGTGIKDDDEEELFYFDAFEGYEVFHDSVETQEPFYFDAFEGYDVFHNSFQSDEDFSSLSRDRPVSHAFVSALATADEDTIGDNRMSTFDTSLSFCVCNNSATGHICNDKTKYHGELVPSIFVVGTATGTTGKLNMGTIILSVHDNAGVEHTFTLHNVVHMPKSPVNIVSTRRLAELFPDANGNVDKRGTGVSSFFDEHLLTWNHKKHKKTLRTDSIGLPECLFNTGYANYACYTEAISRHYDNSIAWCLCSDSDVSNVSEGDVINITNKKSISFLEGMTLILNDGSGSKSLVKFLRLEVVDGGNQTNTKFKNLMGLLCS